MFYIADCISSTVLAFANSHTACLEIVLAMVFCMIQQRNVTIESILHFVHKTGARLVMKLSVRKFYES